MPVNVLPTASPAALSACIGSLLGRIPSPPDGVGEWLSTCFWLLGGIYLVMQIVRGARGEPSPDERFASKGELDRVETGSRDRAVTNGKKIDDLQIDLDRRHDEHRESAAALREKLDELTRTVTKSFEDMHRALGRLEGRDNHGPR